MTLPQGIGERRNEGFGQIRFFDDYKSLVWKHEEGKLEQESDADEFTANDEGTLRIVAGNYYKRLLSEQMKNKIIAPQRGEISNSQVGAVEAIILANQYDPESARNSLNVYFTHWREKYVRQNTQKKRANISGFEKMIMSILSEPIEKTLDVKADSVMGFRTDELLDKKEKDLLKIQYILELLRYDNRKGA